MPTHRLISLFELCLNAISDGNGTGSTLARFSEESCSFKLLEGELFRIGCFSAPGSTSWNGGSSLRCSSKYVRCKSLNLGMKSMRASVKYTVLNRGTTFKAVERIPISSGDEFGNFLAKTWFSIQFDLRMRILKMVAIHALVV